MRESRYRRSRARPFRKTVAPRVREQHSRKCTLSTGTGRRCSCTPAYVATVRHEGRSLERSFRVLAEAVAWSEDARNAARRGELPTLPREQAPPLRDLAISFLHRAHAGEALTSSRRRYAEATLVGYEAALRLRVLPHSDARTGIPLGDMSASFLDARTSQGLVDAVAVRDGASRARAAAAALSAVVRDGYARGYIDQLLPRLLLPPPSRARVQALMYEEAELLIAAARADDETHRRSLLGPLVTLLLASGCRISEALALVWGPEGLDLDAEQPQARISRESTKTDAGARSIPLDVAAVRVLRRHRLATGRPPDGAPVFADDAGRPAVRSGRVRFGFKRAAEASGLRGLTFHGLRHTHATWLASAGIPAAIAAARLGHSDGGALFLRVYAHPAAVEGFAVPAALAAHRAACTGR